MFVSLEGPEGAGKTTVIRHLQNWLCQSGHRVCVTREPGAALHGKIRQLLLEGGTLDPKTELFLFLADRSEHGASVIRPALADGQVVLCDRYADSTVVYQGYARGLDTTLLRQWNAFATQGLVPELTLLLDLDPEIGLSRLQNPDRLDREPLAFHRAVREGFLAEAKREPDRWVVIDASAPLQDVCDAATKALSERMKT